MFVTRGRQHAKGVVKVPSNALMDLADASEAFGYSPWELLMTTGLIYALPPAAIYYTFKRYMVSGLTAGAVKS